MFSFHSDLGKPDAYWSVSITESHVTSGIHGKRVLRVGVGLKERIGRIVGTRIQESHPSTQVMFWCHWLITVTVVKWLTLIPLRPKLLWFIFRTLVLTSQRTQPLSTPKINQLRLFRTMIDIACADRRKEIHSVDNIQNFFFISNCSYNHHRGVNGWTVVLRSLYGCRRDTTSTWTNVFRWSARRSYKWN
jgi:hypothetical protein